MTPSQFLSILACMFAGFVLNFVAIDKARHDLTLIVYDTAKLAIASCQSK